MNRLLISGTHSIPVQSYKQNIKLVVAKKFPNDLNTKLDRYLLNLPDELKFSFYWKEIWIMPIEICAKVKCICKTKRTAAQIAFSTWLLYANTREKVTRAGTTSIGYDTNPYLWHPASNDLSFMFAIFWRSEQRFHILKANAYFLNR